MMQRHEQDTFLIAEAAVFFSGPSISRVKASRRSRNCSGNKMFFVFFPSLKYDYFSFKSQRHVLAPKVNFVRNHKLSLVTAWKEDSRCL